MKECFGCCRRLTLGVAVVAMFAYGARAQAQCTGDMSLVPRGLIDTTSGDRLPLPAGASIAGDTITLPQGGVIVEMEVLINWADPAAPCLLGTAQLKLDLTSTPIGLDNGIGSPLVLRNFPTFGNSGYISTQECFNNSRAGCDPGNGFPACDIATEGPCVGRGDFAMSTQVPAPIATVAFPDPNYEYLLVSQSGGQEEMGRPYMGTLLVDVPAGAAGTYELAINPNPLATFLSDDQVNDIPRNFLASGFISIVTGSCCRNLGTPAATCTDNDTAGTCTGVDIFRPNVDCTVACPSCLVDADCDDSDACTSDVCNTVTGVCSNAETFNSATTCCDPASGVVEDPVDGDPCTDDTCTISPLGSGSRGAASNPPAAQGTACDDGRACFINDVCDGAGACAGDDVNAIPCPNGNADCPNVGTGCNAATGFCECSEDTPLGIGIDAGGLPDVNCFQVGEAVTARVQIGAGSEQVAGGQFLIGYDPSCLSLVGIDDCGGIFNNNILTEVDQTTGTIFLAVSTATGVSPVDFSTGPADLACLRFVKTADCAACQICLGDSNPRNTILSNTAGNRVGQLRTACSKPIRRNGGVTLNTPPGDSVNTHCNTTVGAVSWNAPNASDLCEGDLSPSLVCQAQHDGGVNIGALIMNGGAFPQGTSFFTCTATNSCGDSKTNVWTVQVSDQTSLDVQVELGAPINPGTFTRAITFKAYTGCASAPQVICQEMDFGGIFNFPGHASGSLKLNKTNFDCITAKDVLHTLRSVTVPVCAGDGRWKAIWKGDPSNTINPGNWLIGGNLDSFKAGALPSDQNAVNILDFVMLMAEIANGSAPGTNTTCLDAGPNGDINADGAVDSGDFSAMLDNFLVTAKDLCCVGSTAGAAAPPRTSITVKELRAMGLGNMATADLNRDGVVDLDDMALYMQGVDPVQNIRKGAKDRGIRSR